MASKSFLHVQGREVVWAGTKQEARDLLDVIPLAEAAAEQALGIKGAKTPLPETLPPKPIKKIYGTIFEACFIAYLLTWQTLKQGNMWLLILPAQLLDISPNLTELGKMSGSYDLVLQVIWPCTTRRGIVV